MLCILLRRKWPIGPFAFNKLIELIVSAPVCPGAVCGLRQRENRGRGPDARA